MKKIKFLFWQLLSRIIYGNCYFLDSNIIVSNEPKSDERVEKIPKIFAKYLITDVVEKETNELLNSGLHRIFPYNYEIVRFSKLREILPSLCPVYYNLITWMYNPANISSPEFILHMIQSLKLRGRKVSDGMEKLYMYFMNRLKNGADGVINAAGKPKTLLSKNIDISAFQYFRKKIKNRNSENLLNDYKNVSTIILFSLVEKINTVFITADRDLLAIILTLAESLAQGMTFSYFILPTLTNEDKMYLLSGKKITRFLDFEKFKEYNNNLMGDILNPYWQKDHISFKIRLWDNQEKCFTKDMVINFNADGRELILNMHGPLSCPFAKNNTHGNWLHYLYWPPSPKTRNVVKVLLSAKKIINKTNIYIPDYIHQVKCKYSIDEKNGKLKEYYGHWL